MIVTEGDRPIVQEKDSFWISPPIAEDNAGFASTSAMPPAYEAFGASSSSNRPVASPTPAAPVVSPVEMDAGSSRIPVTGRRVNHFSLFSHINPISGRFLIDPLLPDGPILTRVVKLIERRILWRDLSVEHNHMHGQTSDVSAEFRTRHANIKLELAVVGLPPSTMMASQARVRGSIAAFSYNGSIMIDVFELHDDRCVDLNVFSQQGDIVVLLPPTFSGTISTRQLRARLDLLPGFSARQTMRETGTETVMTLNCEDDVGNRFGQQSSGADHCVIESPAGRITVGLSGIDVYHGRVRSGGLLQALEDAVQFGAKLVEDRLRKR